MSEGWAYLGVVSVKDYGSFCSYVLGKITQSNNYIKIFLGL